MNKSDAEEYTQSLGQIVSGAWRQIALATRLGVPKALGMSTPQWVNSHLGGYVRLNKEDRRLAIEELKADGHSLRETGEILGISPATAMRAVSNETPDDNSPLVGGGGEADFVSNETAPLDAVAALAADSATTAGMAREARKADRAAALDEIRNAPVTRTDSRYDVIVIDPPWDMQKIEREVRPNQVAFDYPTMTEEQLMDFGDVVNEMAADDCHMFMWTTQKYLPMSLRLIEHYGFRYVLVMVWHKAGGFQPIGLPQYNCEFAVYARKGTPQFVDTKAFNCCFDAPRQEHSRKPGYFYELLARVTAGARIDVFSRETHAGFAQYGNEADKFQKAG